MNKKSATMNQQPDKFFRDKLLGYQQDAPANVWNKVSRNVTSNRRRVLWLRYAASILIVVVSGVAIYSFLNDQPSQTIAENHPIPQETNAVNQDSSTTQALPGDNSVSRENQSLTPDAPGPQADLARATPRKKRSLPRNNDTPAEKKSEVIEPSTVITDRLSEVVTIEPNPVIAIIKEEEQPALEAKLAPNDKRKSVTITFTAEEVDKKYLKKNTDAEATPEAKGSSGLRKLLHKANDLTSNQDLLGDLRQKKNEILAMNFKSEKQTPAND